MIKPLIYVDVKKALKMSMISQHPSLYSELWISSHQSIQNIFWNCLPRSDTIMVRRKCEPENHTRSCFMYYSCNQCVRNTWTSLKRNEFITFRNLKTAITIFIALRSCSKWKQLAIFTPKRYFEKQIESVIFVSRCYMYLRRTTVIAVWQIVLSFKNERSLTSFP